jgi:putative ABC transport system substrate-binding protein
MRRRDFIILLGGGTAWPLATRAQEKGRTYRLGSLHQSPRNASHHVAFFDEMRRLGFVEGENLLADEHGYGLHIEELAQHASELVRSQVDVIVCAGVAPVRAAQQATKTIPIVGNADDLVASGLVRSLAHPEGNTTGFSILATELDGKRLEILMETVPGARKMAVLTDGRTTLPQQLEMLQEAARTRGIDLLVCQAAKPEEIAGAIEAAKNSGTEALNVLSSGLLFNGRQIIMERVAALRIPTIYQWPTESEEGGLIAYGPRLAELYRDITAQQVVKLLRGAKPQDLPVEQPTKFELVINLKTAKALGIAIPQALLVAADEVIE